MSARQYQEIPESSLADDRPPRRGFRSRYADKDYQTNINTQTDQSRHPELTENNNEREMTTPRQSQGTPAYLRPHSRGRVDDDITSLTSLGKTNTNKWATKTTEQVTQTSQSDTRNTTSAGPSDTVSFSKFNNEGTTSTASKIPHQDHTNMSWTKTTSLAPFNPFQERSEPHPQQLRPSAALYRLAQTLYKRDPKSWTIEDVHTPQSSDGTSILVSALVDYASTTLNPEMSPAQCLHLAQVAVTTSPILLLEYIQDQTKGLDFIQQVEQMNTPPSLEKTLHPAATPGLIYDSSLRRSLLDRDIIRTEMIEITHTFTQCYYPKQAATMKDFLQSVTVQILLDYIYKPGFLVSDLQNRGRQMNFSPPKWYRLSIHPDEKIVTTPCHHITWRSIPISLPDVELNLDIDINLLVQQPFTAQRTALLTAIPLIFDSRPSREGCMETLALVENATPEEIYIFLTKNMIRPIRQNQSDMSTTTNNTEDVEHTLYCVRFEHTDRKNHGFWNESPGAVLIRWIKAVLPVVTDNNFTLILSQAPHARIPNDRKLTTAFTATSEQLEDFTHNCKSNKRLTSFEVWIKSTCSDLNNLLMVSKSGTRAVDYIAGMKSARIWMEIISQTMDGIVPVLMLGGSIETDPDDMIGAELNDRLLQAHIDLAKCPNFDIAFCAVHTSNIKGAVMAKCIMAKKETAGALHHLFENMITPGMQERHLVTRDYFFAPILYPPSDRSDRELSKAMNRQREFTESTIQTTIVGLVDVNPFTDIPKQTRDFYTQELEENNKSIVELILLSKTPDRANAIISSPIRKVSTNRKQNRLYLTALKEDTGNLITVTKIIAKTMEVWYPGRSMRVRCDLEATRIYMESNIANQEATRVTMRAQPISERWQSESLIKTQLQMKSTDNPSTLKETAKQGIEQTFTQSDAQKNTQTQEAQQNHTTTTTPATDVQPQETVEASTEQKYNPDLRLEIVEMKEEIKAIKDIIREQESRPRIISEDTMASTISTMVETNIQASFTSTARLVVLCETQLVEQTMMMTSFISHFSQKLIDIHTRVLDAKKSDDDVTTMIKTHQQLLSDVIEDIAKMKNAQEQMIYNIETKSKLLAEDQSITSTPADDTVTTKYKESPEPRKQDDKTQEEKDRKIRARALGILTLADTMPFKSKTRTWEEEADKDEEQNKSQPTSTESTSKNTCAICKQTDLGLIYCNRCPEDAREVYHPTCLTFIKRSMERICIQCEMNPHPKHSNHDTTMHPSDSPVLKTPEEEVKPQMKTHTKSEPQTSDEDATKVGGTSSDSDESHSSTDSTSSDDSFNQKYPTQRNPISTHKSGQLPPYLNSDKNALPQTTELDPMIASPVKTRAARRAAESATQESTTDTDNDSPHEQ